MFQACVVKGKLKFYQLQCIYYTCSDENKKLTLCLKACFITFNFDPYQEAALMTTHCVVNGLLMGFVTMMTTSDTCLDPVGNPVKYAVRMVQTK